MKIPPALVLALLAVTVPAIGAETVYRCDDNGRTTFTETASGPSCRPLTLKEHRPDPREVELQRRDLEDWNRRREAEVRQSLERESAAETQRRKAELAALGSGQARTGHTAHKSRGSRRRAGDGTAHRTTRAAGPVVPPEITGTVGAGQR